MSTDVRSHVVLGMGMMVEGVRLVGMAARVTLAELSTHVINTLVPSVTKPGNEQLVETRGSYDVFEQFIDHRHGTH